MPAFSTNGIRVFNSNTFKNTVAEVPVYVGFLQSPKDDHGRPIDYKDSAKNTSKIKSSVQYMRRIRSEDVVSVIPRINWHSGEVYDQYTDKEDMINGRNPATNSYYRFYVITEESNVYMCLSNNNQAPSTQAPTGQNTSLITTSDGYVWKYMYTVRFSDAEKFMTSAWIPCRTLLTGDDSSQWNVQNSAIPGTVDRVDVTDGGSGYNAYTPPKIKIEGDGDGATAVSDVDKNGKVVSIRITNPGRGYSYATVKIDDNNQSAKGDTTISPINGHGSDAVLELGGVYSMIVTSIVGTEGSTLVSNSMYNTAVMVSSPLSKRRGFQLVLNSVDGLNIGDTIRTPNGASGTIFNVNRNDRTIVTDSSGKPFLRGEEILFKDKSIAVINNVNENVYLPVLDADIKGEDYQRNSGNLLLVSTFNDRTIELKQIHRVRLIIST